MVQTDVENVWYTKISDVDFKEQDWTYESMNSYKIQLQFK